MKDRNIRYIKIAIIIALVLSGCAYHADIVRMPDRSVYNQSVILNNTRYILLSRFCDSYNLDWDWDLVSQRIEIKTGKRTVVLRPGSGLAVIDRKTCEFDYPVEYKNGTAYIPVKTAVFISEDVFGLRKYPAPVKGQHRIEMIVIDPGHGGKDPGAVSRYGTKEKDIVLDISKRLKRNLEKKGFNVILTRDKDIFIPLGKRAEIANRKKAQLFISVHANAARYSRAKGFEVYYLSEATNDNARALAAAENASLKFEEKTISEEKGAFSKNPTVCDLILSENREVSRELAYYICNATSDNLGMKKRGVKGARFAVLKGTVMPAILVEVGFLTNRREEFKLKSTSFREKIANAISRAIISYKKEYERTDGFSR